MAKISYTGARGELCRQFMHTPGGGRYCQRPCSPGSVYCKEHTRKHKAAGRPTTPNHPDLPEWARMPIRAK